MMLEDQGKSLQEREKSQVGMKPGKLEKVTAGNHIAYTAVDYPRLTHSKLCQVGKVLNVSRREGCVVVHKYTPVSDGRLRLKWMPTYIEDGAEVVGSGTKANEETVPAKRIIGPVQLHDGVLAHAAARHLESMGYRFDEKSVGYEGGSLTAALLADGTSERFEELVMLCR